MEFPAVGQGGFEDPSVTLQATPATWMSWTFSGAGIAHNSSTYLAGTGPAPQGTHVAFVPGTTSLSTSFTFQPGTWRLSFRGVQRRVSTNDGTNDDAQALRITIGAVEVLEEVLGTGSYANYVTRPLTFTSAVSRTVTIAGLDPAALGHMALLDDVRIERVDDWTVSATWGGQPVPGTNDIVLLPAGSRVWISGNVTVKSVDVSGELLTGHANVSLSTDYLRVSGTGARLEVGRELTPFEQLFTLTLNGTGMKDLSASNGGSIDLHGIPRTVPVGNGEVRTWTHLAQTALPGATSLLVAQPVKWKAGDEIVVVGTNWFSPDPSPPVDFDQAEKVKVNSVDAAGTTVTFKPALQFTHHGAAPQTFSNGIRSWTLDQRAEVGLLTHNVRVQGDTASETSKWGGHVMIVGGGCGPAPTAGRGRFSSVEFFRLGQQAQLARYPVHWHMGHDAGAGQFIKNSSIHHSFNRALTIHATDSLQVLGNVAYEHMGHGIFLEEGSERNNRIRHNLALSTVRPPPNQALLPSDYLYASAQNRSPATFWITNAENEFVGNVAGGTVGTGYWFALPESPLGMSCSTIYPDESPLLAFDDNVAHSSGSGFDVHDTINPLNDEVVSNHRWRPAQTGQAMLNRMTIYACWTGIYSGSGLDITAPSPEKIRFEDCVIADTFAAMTFAGYDVVQNSCLVADSGTGIQTSPSSTAYTVYDGPGRLYESHLVGYTNSSRSMFGHSGAATRSVNHRIRGLTFDPPTLPAAAFVNYHLFMTSDPSLWGLVLAYEASPGAFLASMVFDHPMLTTPLDTTYPNSFTHPLVPLSAPKLSPFRFAHLRAYHPTITTGAVSPYNALPNVTLTRLYTDSAAVTTSTNFVYSDNTYLHRQFPVALNLPGQVEGFDYILTWPMPLPPSPIVLHVDDMDTDLIPAGSLFRIQLQPLGNVIATLQVQRNGSPLAPVPLGQLASQPATAWAVSGSSLHFRVVSATRGEVLTLSW